MCSFRGGDIKTLLRESVKPFPKAIPAAFIPALHSILSQMSNKVVLLIAQQLGITGQQFTFRLENY